MTRPASALRGLLTSEASAGLLLMAAAALALVVANSSLAPAYRAALDAHVGPLSVLHWLNDALMALFFLLVGLEIKRELADGHLSRWRDRALPGFAAAGGMIAPALIFVAIAGRDPGLQPGWAIPTATDIAFALGVLALLGQRVPVSLKIFLTALAILDDLGAVAIIALFYTAGLDLVWLSWAAALVAVGAGMARLGIERPITWLLLGVALWGCLQRAGVHPTLAGVALAAIVPLRRSPGRPDDEASPLHRIEHGLQPWVAYLVLPIFAFANAGVTLSGIASTFAQPLPLGIAAGLLLGKPLGVFGATALAIRAGWAVRPEGAGRAQLFGVACLCGIGFTMSLFIGLLAFPTAEALQIEVKAGILTGSLLSALAGVGVLLAARAPVIRR